jgi:hypothetical protein
MNHLVTRIWNPIHDVSYHEWPQEATALAVEECETPERHPFSEESVMLRRISLLGG